MFTRGRCNERRFQAILTNPALFEMVAFTRGSWQGAEAIDDFIAFELPPHGRACRQQPDHSRRPPQDDGTETNPICFPIRGMRRRAVGRALPKK